MHRIGRGVTAAVLGVGLVAVPAVTATNVAMAQQAPMQGQQQPPDDDGGESYWGLLGLTGLLGLAGLGGRRRDTDEHRHGGTGAR